MIYRLEHGSYYLYDEDLSGRPDWGHMILVCDQLAVAFSVETVSGERHYTLHKHGSPEFCRQWAKESRERYRKGGFFEQADTMAVIEFSKEFPVEEINRCLSTSGYLKRIVEGPVGRVRVRAHDQS